MVTEELLAYIKRQQANRVPEESIRAILLANGWLKIDVDKAFDSLFKVEESKIVTSQELRTKVASLSPNMTAQARPTISRTRRRLCVFWFIFGKRLISRANRQ